jgi:hypothetical protein
VGSGARREGENWEGMCQRDDERHLGNIILGGIGGGGGRAQDHSCRRQNLVAIDNDVTFVAEIVGQRGVYWCIGHSPCRPPGH